MSEEILNQEVKSADQQKLENIKKAINNINNQKNKFLFCVPDSNSPVASIYEIYFHATTLKKLGFDVKILTEKGDYVVPNWIESELTDFEHISMEKTNIPISVDDVLVLPEVFSNVMEQTKEMPCLRIVLLQSVDYMVNSLLPGMDWSSLNIQKVITTSDNLKNMLNDYYGAGKFDIKSYNIGIPSYFHRSDEPQRPIISVLGRNANDISKVVKLFYARYPQFSWITFDTMVTQSKPPQPLRRIDFAERLRKNFAALWIDRIASFGTFPLECMLSGTIPIAIKPDITPEYLVTTNAEGKKEYVVNAGAWTDDIYSLPMLLGDVVTKYLDDSIGDDIYDSMGKIAEKYNQETSAKQIENIYYELLKERLLILENAVKELENPVSLNPETDLSSSALEISNENPVTSNSETNLSSSAPEITGEYVDAKK